MFAVIISEKGGAERRESFDRTEINVGRVQGNELMLPKGNVSKRHARLLYRDGRFIVTDLKSTNGTYVNGRKIAQATIVREGDKIYIGDFVLRVEMTAGAPVSKLVPSVESTHNGPPPVESEIPDPPFGLRPPEKLPSLPTPNRGDRAGDSPRTGQDVVSHFPLEQDPDDSAPFPDPTPMPIPRPSLTRPGSGAAPSTNPPRSSSPPLLAAHGTTSPTSTASPVSVASPLSVASPMSAVSSASAVSQHGAISSGVPTPAPRRTSVPSASEPIEKTPLAAHRAALIGLMDRVSEEVDLSVITSEAETEEPLASRISQALQERIASMKIAGELRDTMPDALVAEARREIFELGPLGPMLEDEDVSEIQVIRHDYVVAMHGKKQVQSEIAFTSEMAVARAIRRLCAQSGKPLAEGEVFVDRRLPRGARMTAVLPPASDQGHMLVIRKPQRADLTLEDLVRSGTISRTMAGLLSTCVNARANILVTGALGAGTTSLIGALAAAGSTDDRVVVLQEEDELIFNQPHTVSILLGDTSELGARAVQAAARMHPDRLVIGTFSGQVAAEVVDAIGQGADGVLAAARVPTLRQAVARLSASIAASRSGSTPETAREALASSFDLVIEVARQRDGRHRALRVAELFMQGGAIAVRDVWSFVIERTAAGGAIEGTFQSTGVIPAIVEDLTARGIMIDTSVFKRHQSR